ncbi:hypothetical protein LCGC14_2223760 [marine sediment metagenome]|uniref:Uncharacterized protein n=1 Tax=marine sediment metagenome TaxID=412755 RepID=A0A0F9G5Q1_9ZZZZ
MTEQKVWKQERPPWCSNSTCLFKRRVMDSLCGGEMPEPVPHAGDYNTFRICFNDDETPVCPVLPIMFNRTDLNWLRWIFDALDGRQTSFVGTRKVEEG